MQRDDGKERKNEGKIMKVGEKEEKKNEGRE